MGSGWSSRVTRVPRTWEPRCQCLARRDWWARQRRRLERCVIPARAFIIRFPNGDFEYDFSRLAAPQPGEILRRQGVLWSVVQVKDDVVKEIHVARAPEEKATGTAQQNDAVP